MKVLLLVCIAMLSAVPVGAQHSVADVENTQTPSATVKRLANVDVLDMLKAGLSQDIVIAKIRASACEFDTAPAALRVLKDANVPDAVILAMVQAPSGLPPTQ